MRALLVETALAIAVAACSHQSSKLDQVPLHDSAAAKEADPWSSALGGSKTDDDHDAMSASGGLGGGFDLQGMLQKVKAALDKPGFYETPESSKDFDAGKPHWGVLALSGQIVEKEAFSLTGGKGTELTKLAARLRELASDAQLTGLVVRVGGIAASLPDAIELRAAMHDLRAAGKHLYCHVEGAENITYLVLAACERIAVAPLGEIVIEGPAAMPIHIKGLLDKLGVQADFIHVGAYKGAAEPLTRDAPSKEMEETIGAILDRRLQTMVDVIAAERKLEPARVHALIDRAIMPAADAKAEHLIDDVATFEAFRDAVDAPWTRIELEPEQQLKSMLAVARFLGAMPVDRPMGDHVAVVYAVGDIVDGDGDGLLGARQQIASHTLVPALRALAADDSVKAVVLRIDSGGGSAEASEQIWHAVNELRGKKPVVVSMSDVAASGGYYIACGANRIFALDDTLTGSIGVVGGRIAPAAALAKLGVTTFPIGRGKHATMNSLAPWTDEERALIQTLMADVYKTFVGRVADGRHKQPAEIDAIAQGRVWTGAKAKDLGLVDEIGGLDAAVAYARTLAKVGAGSDLEIYPPTPTLRDVVNGFGGGVHAPLGLSAPHELAELARSIDPTLGDAVGHLLDVAASFATSRVQARAFVPVLR